MRPLLIGPLVTAVFALTVAYFFWTGTVREWDPNQVDLSKLDEQRHMAECYRVRCGHVGASPVLACAWRELVGGGLLGKRRLNKPSHGGDLFGPGPESSKRPDG